MQNILDQIVAQKRLEINALYQQHDFAVLRQNAQPAQRHFYQEMAAARAVKKPFFITEFKRKSPSEGWINEHADVAAQIAAYAQAGAKAISVLTDTPFFGGTYADLAIAAQTIARQPIGQRPLLLQKDFVLDPIQIYLARQHGADLILLIAAILAPQQLEMLRATAEALGMGAIVEVHDAEELDKVQHLPFPVLGVNNRDLKTFRTALNRVNFLAQKAQGRFLIAESGVKDYRDFQVVKNADGFLIGTGLMTEAQKGGVPTDFAAFYRTDGQLLFKACGIRETEMLQSPLAADYIGINFSPVSKRRIDPAILDGQPLPPNAVAVFYKNSETEIRDILAKYPFKMVQLYANETQPEFVRTLKKKVLMACPVRSAEDLPRLEMFAADVDLFILDGAAPGSGQTIDVAIPLDFPYPFLLAGGLHIHNLQAALSFKNCIGVDIASGIETNGQVDVEKINEIATRLEQSSVEKVG